MSGRAGAGITLALAVGLAGSVAATAAVVAGAGLTLTPVPDAPGRYTGHLVKSRAEVTMTPSPAGAFVAGSLADAPASVAGLGRATAELSRPRGLPGSAGCERLSSAPVPVASSTVSYSDGHVGVSVTVSAYGPALAADATAAHLSASGSCGLSVSGTADDLSGRAGDVAFRVRRVGDVTVTVTGVGVDVPGSLSDEVTARARERLAGVCADPSSPPGQSGRTTYGPAHEFTGFLTATEVSASAGAPAPASFPAADDLPAVTRPAPPARPYWPASLPDAVAAPAYPAPPAYPATTATVPVRQPDPTGPGCGWSFTGATPPPFDAAAVDAANSAALTAATAHLDSELARYEPAVQSWRSAYTRYTADVARYRRYADTVAATAKEWDRQRTLQAEYAKAKAAYDRAVADAARRRDAQDRYDAAVAACASTPSPAQCPPERPTILDRVSGYVPPAPAPPPDPRPPREQDR